MKFFVDSAFVFIPLKTSISACCCSSHPIPYNNYIYTFIEKSSVNQAVKNNPEKFPSSYIDKADMDELTKGAVNYHLAEVKHIILFLSLSLLPVICS